MPTARTRGWRHDNEIVMSEAALALLRARSAPLRMIIFDCDGVLVDSEPVANRVCAAEISALGWPMTAVESHTRFLGMSLSDMRPVIEAKLGRQLPAGWVAYLADRLVETLSQEAVLIDGAEATLRATSALGLDWRIASNSGPEELRAKFARTGLASLVEGRVHSANEVIRRGGRGKPSPDLFLAAAAASGLPPETCVVVEDSLTGIRAARAAGMTCLVFAPGNDSPTLAEPDTAPVRSLYHLPDLFGAVL
jgi:HAD superfamily hydrolase (TIGR01509 family)